MPKEDEKEKKLYPHFSVYYDKDVWIQLEAWMKMRGVKSKSQACLLIFREYFEFYDTIEKKIERIIDRRFAELKGN
jgi:hypothetical protein